MLDIFKFSFLVLLVRIDAFLIFLAGVHAYLRQDGRAWKSNSKAPLIASSICAGALLALCAIASAEIIKIHVFASVVALFGLASAIVFINKLKQLDCPHALDIHHCYRTWRNWVEGGTWDDKPRNAPPVLPKYLLDEPEGRAISLYIFRALAYLNHPPDPASTSNVRTYALDRSFYYEWVCVCDESTPKRIRAYCQGLASSCRSSILGLVLEWTTCLGV
ncbi:unnamed protein product [Amoebophrya sp. A25]|nr:unnamed protein product [Amoebophrya sp. A25]|eukprot:GSA25T00022922001.1